MISWMISLAVAGAVDAPVREVTVYSDRARVQRVASLTCSGVQTVELPLLLETVDTSTLRVDAQGAEVRRVDVAFVDAQDVPADEAKALLAKIEAMDDQINLLAAQRQVTFDQSQDLERITPSVPPSEPLKPRPTMQPAGWAPALIAVDTQDAKLRAKVAEQDLKLEQLRKERDALSRQAGTLGGAERKAGYQVKVSVAGSGPCKLTATYMVNRARWYPSYDLQYLPKSGQVQVSFAGLVSQESGEDWEDAQLELSTAIPATATAWPKLLSWKIGDRERFIPTPIAQIEPAKPAPASYPPAPKLEPQAGEWRQRLLSAARMAPPPPPPPPASRAPSKPSRQYSRAMEDEEAKEMAAEAAPEEAYAEEIAVAAARPQPSVPFSSMGAAPSAAPSAMRKRAVRSPQAIARGGYAQPQMGMALGPPPSYQPPSYDPKLPASAAGGYDLLYKSARAESIGSGKGPRRVALFSQMWPVSVERKIFPALVPEAFLVAEIKNPSEQPLPSGSANLFVGEDPAGTAELKLVSPGEQFTLPLGLDRAIRAIRNVRLVQTETGFIIGKEEITEYVTTIELANPYSMPVAITVVDQKPVTNDKNVEVKLLKSTPQISKQDDVKGQLEWKLTLPPNGKSVITFNYSIKRPKSWRLYQ